MSAYLMPVLRSLVSKVSSWADHFFHIFFLMVAASAWLPKVAGGGGGL